MSVRTIQYFIITLFIILLSGCAGVHPICDTCTNTNNNATPTNNSLSTLQSQGVQIIQTGQTIAVIIPSDQLFNTDSANLNSNASQILNPLVGYLQNFQIVSLQVAGYSDNPGSSVRNQAISDQQAQQVVAFLTNNNIDARVIYADGNGNQYPLVNDEASNTLSTLNRRIELHFRYVVVPPI